MSQMKLKIQPDSGIPSMVAQIVQHKKSSRMVLFGLRNLSEVCSPLKNRYKDNSIMALCENVVPSITFCIETYSTNEEIVLAGIKVLKGISDYLVENSNSEFLKKLEEDGGIKAGILATKCSTKWDNDECMILAVGYLSTLKAITSNVDFSEVLSDVVRGISPKKSVEYNAMIFRFIAQALEDPRNVASISDDMLMEKILTILSELNASAPRASEAAECGLRILDKLKVPSPPNSRHLGLVVKALDTFKSKRGLYDRMCKFLRSMITVEDVERTLAQLSNDSCAPEEKQQALGRMVAMSYVSSYADVIVAAGAVKLLCDAILTSVASFDPQNPDPQLSKGLEGTCKLLEKIAENPLNADAVSNAGGVEAFTKALHMIQASSSTTGGLLDALLPLLKNPSNLKQFNNNNGVQLVLAALQRHNKDVRIVTGGLRLVTLHLTLDTPLPEVYDAAALKMYTSLLNTYRQNVEVQNSMIKCVERIVEIVNSFSSIKEIYTIIVSTLQQNVLLDPAYATTALTVIDRVRSRLSLDDSGIRSMTVDAVLNTMLQWKNMTDIQFLGKTILKSITTQTEVDKCFQDLHALVSSKSSKPEEVFKVLAAVTGLSQLPHLQQSFDSEELKMTIVSGLKQWIQRPPFPQQQRLVKVATMAIESLQSKSSSSSYAVLSELFAIALLPQLRTLSEKQDLNDTSLEDVLRCCHALLTSEARSKSTMEMVNVGQILEIINKISWTYQDLRKVQLFWINMLNEIALIPGGVSLICESGTIKNVMTYMMKVVMYEDIQVAGFQLLTTCLSTSPECVETLRLTGGAELCKTIQKYPNASVNALLSRFSSTILPRQSVEKDISDIIQRVNLDIQNGDVVKATEAISLLMHSCSSTEAIRCIALKRLRSPFFPGDSFLQKASAAEKCKYAIETSKLIMTICKARAGINYLKRTNVHTILDTLMEFMLDTSLPESDDKKEGIEANMVGSRLLANADADSKDSQVSSRMRRKMAQFCMIVQKYPLDKRLLESASAAVATGKISIADSIDQLNEFCHILQVKAREGDGQERACAVASLNQLCFQTDDYRASVFEKNGTLDSLFDALELPFDDDEQLKNTLNSVISLSKSCNIREHLLRVGGNDLLKRRLKSLTTIMMNCPNDDPQTYEHVSRLLLQIITKDDTEFIKETGVVQTISALIDVNPKRYPSLMQMAKFLGIVDPNTTIESLIQEIIACCNASLDEVALMTLCRRLAGICEVELDNAVQSFKEAPKMCEALASVIKKSTLSPATLEAISLLTCILSKRFDPNITSQLKDENALNINVVVSKTLSPLFGSILATEAATANANKGFLINAFMTLAINCNNRKAFPEILATSKKNDLVPLAHKHMDNYQNDPDIVSALMAFLSALSRIDEGFSIVASELAPRQVSKRTQAELLVENQIAILKKHRFCGSVVASGLPVLEAALISQPQLCSNKDMFKDIFMVAEDSSDGICALMDLFGRISSQNSENFESQLSSIKTAFWKMYYSPNTLCDQRDALVLSYVNMLKSVVEQDKLDMIKDLDVLDTLNSLIDDNGSKPHLIGAILTLFTELANSDADYNMAITRNSPVLSTAFIEAQLTHNPQLCVPLTELLSTLVCKEGNGKLVSQLIDVDHVLSLLGTAARQHPEKSDELKLLIDNVRIMIQDDHPDMLTLKQLYHNWIHHEESGEKLDANENPLFANNLNFLCDTTDRYASVPIKNSATEQAEELKYGCLCFSLLHKDPENTLVCIEKNEPNILFGGLRTEHVKDVAQYLVVTARDLCNDAEGAARCSVMEGTKKVLIRLVDVLHGTAATSTAEEADAMMIPRLELMAFISTEPSYFNGTSCMTALIGVWDDCNAKTYTDNTLQYVFRAMRRIMNPAWIDALVKNNIPTRLITVINNKEIKTMLLTDVLFLVGALATIADMKTHIANIGGIEACLNLIVRCIEDTQQNTDAVQINSCLALANICINHTANVSRFISMKGIEISAKVMGNAVADTPKYDVANAVAVLMCNVSYRRDDVKKLYGEKNGAKVLTKAIQKYDGTNNPSAIRCLSSMFKAIGNLALYIPNVKTFLEENLIKTFSDLYLNSECIPDELLFVSLRTMSNLVMENQKQLLEDFGGVLVPILKMLSNTNHESGKMLSMSFDVISNLCRLPVNSDSFIANSGAEITLRVMNTHSDPHVCISGIHLLFVQLSDEKNLQRLLDADVLKFLSLTLDLNTESPDRNSDVYVGALRCLLRLLTMDTVAEQFKDMLGVQAILRLIHNCPDVSSVQIEAYRCFFALLAAFPPPEINDKAVPRKDEWDPEVPDEVARNVLNTLKRPPSPRSWEAIELKEEEIRDLIGDVCYTLRLEASLRQNKLQLIGLGLLAYFACEKIPDTILAFYAGGYNNILCNALTIYPGDLTIIELVRRVTFSSFPSCHAVRETNHECSSHHAQRRSSLEHLSSTYPSIMFPFT